MSISSNASSAAGPSTPLPPSIAELPLTPTPSRDPFSSPPDSLSKYRTAMKQHTTAAWAAALKDLKDHPDVGSRRRDPEYGFDENPFDRHHLEYLSPPKPRAGAHPVSSTQSLRLPPAEKRSLSYQEREEKLRLMLLGESPRACGAQPIAAEDLDVEMSRSRSISPSPSPSPSPANITLGLPVDSPTPGSSAYMHTPFFADAGPSRRPALRSISWLKREHSFNGESSDTPGSSFSEASFEAISGDNYFSMYGGAESAVAGEGGKFSIPPPPIPRPALDQRLSSGVGSGLGLALAGVDLNRGSVISTATESTITSLSSTSTYTPISMPSPAEIQYAQVASIRPARPSILKPRPTPYPPVVHPATPRRRWGGDLGAPGTAGEDEMDGMGAVPEQAGETEEGEEDEWMQGRSISEEMILRAGARCLRSRGMPTRLA